MTTQNPLYRTEKQFNLPAIEREILQFWADEYIFEKSVSARPADNTFVFYEGPPSANGMPGIHHVMARTVKDIFCRYKTLKGFRVYRKAGWDTHGLPIELSVEKTLGIGKEDIGKKITVEAYNETCRREVMKYQDKWETLTHSMGFWLDMEHPYITYDNNYIETLWWLLQKFYQKGYLYKGYTIQPYSPAAGTGLSSHELNQPGCYRDVTDTSVTAMFKLLRNAQAEWLFENADEDVRFLAWTTTPWTLPSNTALAVGSNITYLKIKTFNPYTHAPVSVIMAKDLLLSYFKPEQEGNLAQYDPSQKTIPYQIVGEFEGKQLDALRYEQLLPYSQPENGDAFRVLLGDFVTTEDGTGIVHIAPSFGADDLRVARQYGVGSLTLVDKEGKFVNEVTDFAGRYVKNYKDQSDYVSVDVDIAVKLKKENKVFKIEKFSHNYPHCWRTDKPVIYYPLDSWFIKTSAAKERMAALNETINWKPESTGTGRFGKWLENLQDWNLSRSRFWGTPLPIWRSEDGSEEKCIGSLAELRSEVKKSVEAGLMREELHPNFDLHKPFVDKVILVSDSGKPMYRESDLVDVWFDSGAMPYAQWHFPFENEEKFRLNFPADFIAEGVDQTRGWFYTLHAIAVMLFDSVAFKNVISNGLVLDKNGNKMSKRLGNTVNPFETIAAHGADATRWYMISNSQPWDNLKFDMDGLTEAQRQFFGTLFNTYSFFAIYANIDYFVPNEQQVIPIGERPLLDRWVISKLQSLKKEVDAAYNEYEPTKAARLIGDFVDAHLSNWYVRLNRRRFWKNDEPADKRAAYETLYECLMSVAQLMSPITPFFSDWLYRSLSDPIRATAIQHKTPLAAVSVHLSDWGEAQTDLINPNLEEAMRLAQNTTSLVLALRKKEKIKVRQPLQRILVPVIDAAQQAAFEHVKDIILTEVNVKEIEYVTEDSGMFTKSVKPNFKLLGARLGHKMAAVKNEIEKLNQEEIRAFEKNGLLTLNIDDETVIIDKNEVAISSKDVPGWLVNSIDGITIALDIHISEALKNEGYAREIVNKIQNIRKELDLNVTTRLRVVLSEEVVLLPAIQTYHNYICSETLIEHLDIQPKTQTEAWQQTLDINGEPLNIIIHHS